MGVEIVTIVNQSGKVISNGKNVFSVLKEAKAAYDEKKESIKAEKALKRSNTYDIPVAPRYEDEPYYQYGHGVVRRSSHEDVQSRASSHRSHRSKQSHRSRSTRHRPEPRPALTENNLKTLSEVSSTAPSQRPVAYRSPYAETMPWETQLTLARRSSGAPTAPRAPTQYDYPVQYADEYEQEPYYYEEDPRYYVPVHRSRSDPSMRKDPDMDLAYGNIPPDLADRVDLDPAYKAAEKERKARNLMKRIDSMLTEAHCVHHSANHMIKHLQDKPETAASVALSLAELSTLVGKMSPSFLGVIKGGSPAIFALLASPQFLIASGVAVGVSVVMFGGWKIVKRMKEQKQLDAARALAFEGAGAAPGRAPTYYAPSRGGEHPPYPLTEEGSQGYDEAVVLDEELSSIETWRRGISAFGEDESADMELISPEAQRAMRSQYGDDIDDTRTERSGRTSKTSKTAKSHKTTRTSASSKHHTDVPDRKSSKAASTVAPSKAATSKKDDAATVVKDDDAVSEAGSQRSHRSSRSTKTTKTSKTSASRRTVKAIEDGSNNKENDLDAVLGRPKKDNMLKTLFKKREKEMGGGSNNRSASTLKLA